MKLYTVILACLACMIAGAILLYVDASNLLIGIALIALPSVVLLQMVLIAIAQLFVRARRVDKITPRAGEEPSELQSVLSAFAGFRIFLARAVGIVAMIYGLYARSWYFFALGAALIALFWLLDRFTDDFAAEAQWEAATEEMRGARKENSPVEIRDETR